MPSAPNGAAVGAMLGKKKKPAAAKKSSPKQPTTSAAKPAPSRPVEPTDEEIRLRAYFLAEYRKRNHLYAELDYSPEETAVFESATLFSGIAFPSFRIGATL